jgi:nucleoside-diphosphate-sugar epimerase
MNIYITGYSGLIGRELLNKLVNEDKNSHFFLIGRTKLNLQNENIKYINFDIFKSDIKEIISFFCEHKPTYFFHLAWCTDYGNYLNSDHNKLHEIFSIKIINAFYEYGGGKFIGIGTSLEYDLKFKSPYIEDKSSLSSNNYKYSESKLNVFNYLSSLANVSYLWCRVFFVFGPGQSHERLIPKIILNSIFEKKSLNINLNSYRDYLSTFEIANQIYLMSQTPYIGPVNICSGEAKSLKEILNIIDILSNSHTITSEYTNDFSNDIVYGSDSIIKKYHPEYLYDLYKFKKDLKKTYLSYL